VTQCAYVIKGQAMSDSEQSGSGAGGTEGASVEPVEPLDEDNAAEHHGEFEIPIGMPLSPAEMRRLKAAAEQHRDVDQSERPAQSDSTAQPDNSSQ
jgi:hypothetical protein